MQSIQQVMLEDIQENAIRTARDRKQTTAGGDDYYITLEQLEAILKEFES